MLPEVGQFSLILSLFFALLLVVMPLLGYWKGHRLLLETARPLTFIMSSLVMLSFSILCYSFLNDDFSLVYVTQNANSQLPVWYKFSAVWGGHEGSLLLWVLILCGWCSSVALKIRTLPEDIGPIVLAVLGSVCVGFLSFLLFTSSPFVRLLPDVPVDGGDLNPLLQDIGLILHPPVLYMGYVGFAVAFAFAVTALITGNLNASWARWARPWTAAAWAFLTLGITLGSWWAYYELGWGSWWFWDPVENASFMPWLAGTALLHSLAVTEKRGVFKSWTVLLAIFTFSLSLLGAFLVRSGVLTSVHSFAADPTRGVFILALLVILVGGSLLLYGIRAVQVRSTVSFGLTGREAWLLLNNIFLTVLTLTVLLGTLYPLIFDALGLGKISVGAPYFNAVFTPIALLLMVFMAVGPLSKWYQTPLKSLIAPCVIALVLSILLSVGVVYGYGLEHSALVSFVVVFWVVALSFFDWFSKVSSGSRGWVVRARQLPRNYYGMLLAHLGMAVTLVGIVLVSINSEESMLRLAPGDRAEVAGYEFRFDRVEQVKGPNYVSSKAHFTAFQAGDAVAVLHPEKRFFTTRQQVMTEAALDAGFTRDLYVSLGERIDDTAWSVRIYVKSFVRWIWLGGLLMMAGGLLAALDKRYRKRVGGQ
ncbi:heme lyase CcmF/NrfE family subunit [Marinomonas sp. IMCC 4694]|uniref:heme lyase CcmF/NrfE family subunit n=1 Tax=Marinomonas sp. IMCC 4694 TaxID=2605432 RepID=UPI0011E6528B|nr:heme lyase CcmF/NrfE family subunit [Marinomonas sp. IMCC 4694]TYL48470.1 heme lyase CcmF/NrfE family subunit [Marinomonas sp. IMCC 4694]